MVLKYCKDKNMREYLKNYNGYMYYVQKLPILTKIIKGLLDIHDVGKVHKDFHSGNILFDDS